MQSIQLQDKRFRPYISSEEISQRVDICAAQINHYFADKNSVPIFISVLNGSIYFMADLTRKLNFDFEIDSYKFSSYQGTQSSGEGSSLFGLKLDIESRDIVIVDDIVESGYTMSSLVDSFRALNPKSIKVAVLVHKPACQKVDLKVDFAAITIPDNDFLVGYGFDYNERGRALKDIYILEE